MAWTDVVIPGDAPRSVRTRAARAVALSGVAAWCAAMSLALSMPAFYGTDEPAHLAYVAVLQAGRLPEVDEDMPEGKIEELDRLLAHYERVGEQADRRDVWVANHPPAYYLLSLPVVRVASAIDGGRGPLLAMRLISATAMGLTVVAAGALGARLLPGRPAAAVGAALLVASLGQVIHTGALAYSDALGAFAWTACLVVAVTVLRRPPEQLDQRLAWVSAGVVVLAALTRASTLPAVAIVVLAWGVAALRSHQAGQSARPALRGVVLCTLAPILLAGPFFLRNRALYGSITADRHLLAKFGRQPGEGVVDQLRARALYEQIADQMFGRLREQVTFADGLGVRVVALVTLVALVAAVLSLRTRPWRPTAAGCVAAVVGGATSLALLIGIASFRASGGNLHIRYLVPALPLFAVSVAGGLTRLGRRPLLLVPAVAAVAGVQGVLLWRYLELLEGVTSTPGLTAPSWAPPASTLLLAVWAVLLAVATGVALTLPAGDDARPQRLTAAASVEARGPGSDHQT